jgi:hypothetical protein
LLNTFYCPFIHPSPEAPLSGMMEGWGDTVGPNEIVDIEAFLVTHYLLAGNFLFHKEHLRMCEIRINKKGEANLADVSDLEHSLVVERLLCFNHTRQINKFR